jgi:hypothetical protein
MVNARLIWQAPLFAAFVLVLMSFQDPFRVALCAALLGLMDPVRRLVLTWNLGGELEVKIRA